MSTDTRPTTARRTLRIALASTAAVSALLLTAGCSAIQDIVPNKTPQKHFDAYSDAPRSGESEDLAFFMPKWVPEDAKDIDVRLHVSQPGYVIGFASKDGVDVDDCTALDESYGGTAMTADFLPEEPRARAWSPAATVARSPRSTAAGTAGPRRTPSPVRTTPRPCTVRRTDPAPLSAGRRGAAPHRASRPPWGRPHRPWRAETVGSPLLTRPFLHTEWAEGRVSAP